MPTDTRQPRNSPPAPHTPDTSLTPARTHAPPPAGPPGTRLMPPPPAPALPGSCCRKEPAGSSDTRAWSSDSRLRSLHTFSFESQHRPHHQTGPQDPKLLCLTPSRSEHTHRETKLWRAVSGESISKTPHVLGPCPTAVLWNLPRLVFHPGDTRYLASWNQHLTHFGGFSLKPFQWPTCEHRHIMPVFPRLSSNKSLQSNFYLSEKPLNTVTARKGTGA